MAPTIDGAGRVVIPVAVRQHLGFHPGTELDVVVDDLGVRLVRSVPPPQLHWAGGRWLARPIAPRAKLPEIDPVDWLDAERERWP